MWDCHSCDPGSNPGPGVHTKLRIHNNRNRKLKEEKKNVANKNLESIYNISKIKSQQLEKFKMRDLYNRKVRFENCLRRIDLEIKFKKDRDDPFQFSRGYARKKTRVCLPLLDVLI